MLGPAGGEWAAGFSVCEEGVRFIDRTVEIIGQR